MLKRQHESTTFSQIPALPSVLFNICNQTWDSKSGSKFLASGLMIAYSKTLLTWDGTWEGVGHGTREGGRRSSKGSHGRRGAPKWREAVIEIYKSGARRRRGGLILLHLGGFWPVVTGVRHGGGNGRVWRWGILLLVFHCGAFVLFALNAAHCLAPPGRTQEEEEEVDWIKTELHRLKSSGRSRINDCNMKSACTGTNVRKWKCNDLILSCKSFFSLFFQPIRL